MPMVKSDGTLVIVSRLLNKYYSGQFAQFVQDLIFEQKFLNDSVKSIIIDEVQFEDHQLIQIFDLFKGSKGSSSSPIRHLSLGNIQVTHRLIEYIFA